VGSGQRKIGNRTLIIKSGPRAQSDVEITERKCLGPWGRTAGRATLAACGAVGLIAAGAAVPAGAATVPVGAGVAVQPGFENYHEDVYIHARCAFYKGEITWGRHDIIGEYYVGTNGTLSAHNCREGDAILSLHYDTVDNPRTERVGKVQHERAEKVAYENEDWVNSYKDIWVELCYYSPHGACVHMGPGWPRK
jgi:hypothetical protein